MDVATLKNNFEAQLKDIDEKISKLQEELDKAKEYKLKLQGGMETLDLLSSEEEPVQSVETEIVE
jgi:peptidoglycan hydrolase CwlO-like protein